MGRVSQETLDRMSAFIDSLPEEAQKKCTMCTDTLTHIVKQAEAQTGAGTLTVCNKIAERHNETAAPMDRVSGEQLRSRVINKELGRPDKCRIPTDNQQETTTTESTMSQKRAWKTVENRLSKIVEYMKENCFIDTSIDNKTLCNIADSINHVAVALDCIKEDKKK